MKDHVRQVIEAAADLAMQIDVVCDGNPYAVSIMALGLVLLETTKSASEAGALPASLISGLQGIVDQMVPNYGPDKETANG